MAGKSIFLQATSQSLSDMIHRIISNTFIVEFGIIKAIPAEGVVTVEMSVSNKKSEVIVTDCVLASFASSSLSFRLKPNIDDKVLVLFPRKYHNDMFNLGKNETIISKTGTGYNVFAGIAILLNQYQETTHKNFIDITDGSLILKLGYNEEEEVNVFTLTTDAEGNIVLNSNGTSTIGLGYNKDDEKYMVNLTTDAEGNIVLNSNGTSTVGLGYNKDDEKYMVNLTTDVEGNITINNDVTTITVGAEGDYSIDNGKSTVSVDKDGNVTIDAMSGKISLKNSSANLFTILDGMLQVLNTSLATQGSPASHTVIPSQFQQQATQLGQLMQ